MAVQQQEFVWTVLNVVLNIVSAISRLLMHYRCMLSWSVVYQYITKYSAQINDGVLTKISSKWCLMLGVNPTAMVVTSLRKENWFEPVTSSFLFQNATDLVTVLGSRRELPFRAIKSHDNYVVRQKRIVGPVVTIYFRAFFTKDLTTKNFRLCTKASTI